MDVLMVFIPVLIISSLVLDLLILWLIVPDGLSFLALFT
jgi:hypothetical protein